MAPQDQQTFDIHTYIDIALRRKWYIIIPLVLSVAVAFGAYKRLPKIYSATTLILVQPQRVPTDYVRPTITDSVTSRLNTISQEILSRTRLETVIQEFNLYANLRSKVPLEEIVETMRRAVEVKVLSRPNDRGQNSFSVSYEGEEPRTVMMVTNKLASLFIDENLKVREEQAGKTSEFIVKELRDVESKLKYKEIEIRDFKGRHMGQLPEQWEANQRTLDRLQQQLQTTNDAIRATEDKALLYRNQIEQLGERGRIAASRMARGEGSQGVEGLSGEQGLEDPLIVQYNSLKRDLAAAQSKYTDQHPDVVELKRKVSNLEPRVKELLDQQKAVKEAKSAGRKDGTDMDPSFFSLDPTTQRLLAQYTDQYNGAQLDAKRLRSEEKNLREQIFAYQRRVEETPKREQELSLLTRDYELMKSNYQSLLDKKIQAQMAENLERDQQGEQFKILDPARIPEKPIRPDRNKILMMGLVLGLALGGGLTWFRESLDQSFHTVAEAEGYLGVPVLVAIPNLKEDKGLPYYQRGKKVA